MFVTSWCCREWEWSQALCGGDGEGEEGEEEERLEGGRRAGGAKGVGQERQGGSREVLMEGNNKI